MPAVEDAIPAAVKALPAPVAVEFKGGLQMAVSAADEEVQKSVLQGLNHLHGGGSSRQAGILRRPSARIPSACWRIGGW